MPTNIEQALRDPKNALIPSPFARQLGLRLRTMEPGRAIVELRVRRKVTNTQGALHGGAIATLSDTTMGAACWTTLEAGSPFATLDLRVSFLRSVVEGVLTAEGIIIRSGRTVRFAECSITNEAGELVARASCTFSVLDRPPKRAAASPKRSRKQASSS